MTFVDESLLGTGPIRSAKSAGKQNEADAANQRSAFENAFADAGKKKQPMISISGKTGTDGGTQATVAASQNLKTAAAEAALASEDETAIDQDSSLPLPGSPNDSEMMSAFGATSAAQRLMPQAGEEATVEQDAHRQKSNLTPSDGKGSLRAFIDLANLGTDATADGSQILDEHAGEKLNLLLKDPKAQLSKHSDPNAANSDEALPSNSLDIADAATDRAPADVSHLLALLGATQTPTDVGTTGRHDAGALRVPDAGRERRQGQGRFEGYRGGESVGPLGG